MRHPLLPVLLLLAALSPVEAGASSPKDSLPIITGVTRPGLPPVHGLIRVDQFGYLPEGSKFAVFASPKSGFNADVSLCPGPVAQVRRVADGGVVFSGPLRRWHEGRVDPAAGDAGAWFDFSGLQENGEYYVYDPATGNRSPVFRISRDVYRKVLRAAVRVLYHQRENFSHVAAHAEGPWVDGPVFPQDAHARAVWAKDDVSLERDLRGGWMDAGDMNKYITFLPEVLHPLLYAWRNNPGAFGDDFNIPESGNGLPDLLDEIKFELEWAVRMQDTDGGVFIKMGEIEYGHGFPPSAQSQPRYYGPKSSAATIAYAGVLAHAARVYAGFPAWAGYAKELQTRAVRAFAWYKKNLRTANVDTGEIKSGDADKTFAEQDRLEAVAGLHLWVLSGRPEYHESFRAFHTSLRQFKEHPWSPYDAGQGEVLFDYLTLPKADPVLCAHLRERLEQSLDTALFATREEKSVYRAYMPLTCFHWGSNMIFASSAANAGHVATYGLAGKREAALRTRQADLLHYLHGVNPLGMVYLTKMDSLGAEQSASALYHGWFGKGTPFERNPPPGYLVGGPNKSFGGTGPQREYVWISEQPPAKAYADFCDGHPSNSWEITEPGLYYQAMYIRALSDLVR